MYHKELDNDEFKKQIVVTLFSFQLHVQLESKLLVEILRGDITHSN